MTLPVIAEFKQENDAILVGFALTPDLEVFRGHFPGFPILPGVAQLDWVMQFAVRCFGIAEPAARSFQVKFSDMIQPGVLLLLAMRMDRAGQRLSFEYRVGERIMSSGRITFEGSP